MSRIDELLCEGKRCLRGRGGHAKNFERALECFDLAAQMGDVEAMYQLGRCYLRGMGCLKDEAGAVSCLENAASRGHRGAMLRLATCFHKGQGAPACEELARYWELKALALPE